MPQRTYTDEREKFDHSAHPTGRSVAGDLRAPSGGSTESSGRDERRGGVSQRGPTTSPDSANHTASGRRNSRVRRLDSRGSVNK
jgi:hypothetical protein